MADIISNSNGPDYGAGLTALMKAGGAAPASPQGNIRNLVDPRKVYLARQAGTADGLNDIEKDFAFGDFQNNVSKYGSQAYAVDADIASTSGNDFVKSQVTRTPGETAVDVATGLGLGTADFMLQAGQFLNNISPLGWADRAFGTQLAKPLNDAFSAARHANTNLMNSLYSDVKRHGEEIKEYKNQLDEARHLREQEEAIANGESAFGATMARFAKDAGSAIGNALSTPTALVDMPVDLLASILSMKGLGKLGLGVAKGAGALTDALAGRTATRAGIAGAERAGVAGAEAGAGAAEVAGATAGTAERAGAGITGATEATAGAGTEAATGASAVAGTAGNTATRAATTAAEATAGEAIANQGEGWLAKIGKGFWDKRREMAHVAIQEGGAGTSMAYDTVNRMSYDELEKSSEMFREKKKKYLEQGMSEEQASARAKDEVAQAAAFDAGALQGIIAGPMGRFMPDGLIKSPLKTFFNGNYANNIIRETGEEALEGLGQFGYNVGAKNTYNNDQDLMKDMGRSIGEGAISALVGTAEMGAPRVALKGLGIGTGAVLGKTAKAIDNHQTKNNINTVRNASETLAQSAEALNTAEAAQANASSSNVYSNEDARDSLNKINGINTGFTAEEASEINSAMGMQDTDQGAAKEGENKFEALVGMAQFLAERLKPENLKKDQDSITTLNQVRAFNKIYHSVFEAQPINEILDQIKDEDTKKQVQQAYEAYNKLSQNKAFTGLQKTATAHARQIIAARQDVNTIVNDDKLTDDEKIKRIDETIAAFNLLFDNSLPSDKDLATARNVAEAAQASGLGINQAAVTSFLDEVNTREQQNVALREAVTAEEAMNEKVAQTVGVTTDDIENFRNNKTVSDVAYQKLKQYYGSDTNRLSLSDVIQKVQYHYYHNNEAMVTQTITDYFNYIQSQVNKLNAYRESYAQYQQDLADAKAHGKAFSEVRAQPVQYESYNPEGRVRFKNDKTVIYAGDPALGAALVDETEALVGQFGILKKMFFKGKKLSLKGYKPNEGVTNEQIRDTYKTYVSMKQTKTGKQSADEQTLRETRQNNNSENTNTQQQPTENQTQPKEPTNPNQDSNDSREAAQQEVPSADDSSLANDDIFDQNNEPADNNTKPVDNTNNKSTENAKPAEQVQDNSQNQKPKNYWDIGNLSLKDYLGNMFHGSDAILQGIADTLSGDTHSDGEIEQAVRTAIFQNSFNTGKDVGSKVESAIIKATKHYFSEKAKQKNTEQAKPENTNTTQENHPNPSETNNAKPEETPEKRKQRELAEAWGKALNEENNKSTSPSVDTNTNTDNNSSSQSEQDSNTQENQNNSTETQNKPNEKPKAPEANINCLNGQIRPLNNRGHLAVPGMTHLVPLTEEERNSYRTGTYAGIGSRETPKPILEFMGKVASRLESHGLTLRSGHAKGADQAFESGVSNDKQKEIYLPEDIPNKRFSNSDQAITIAENTHPAPHKLSAYARNCHARNNYQVLGSDLNSPTDFVLCYAPLDKNGNPTGGTSQAIRVATLENVPVFNLAIPGMKEAFYDWFTNTYLPSKEAKLNQGKPEVTETTAEYLDNTNSIEETTTETTSEETSSNTIEQTNESVEDTTVVEDSTDNINEAASTSFLDEVRKNVHRVQKRLYKFVNEKFLPYKELIDQLRNAVTDNDFRTQLNKDLTQKDATFLLNALDYSNSHSFINDFTRKLKAQLEPNATINEVAVSFPVAMTSPFYGIHKEKGEVKLSKVTYSEVLSVLRDPAKLAKVSDDELQRIYNLFPSLMLMDINEKGQAVLNKDMVANLALNALAVMSDNKNGSGASWDQIATSLGMDLADIKSIRNADGENVGYQFLKTVSEGAIVTPLFDAMSRNIKKSLGLSFNRRYVSLAATQATSDVLANMVLKALTDESNGKNTNYFTLKKFDVGNGIAVISQNTENTRSKEIFTDFENIKGVNELIQNDRVGEIGDIVIDGKESEPAESTQTRYLHTGIELRPKAKAALHNYEKVKYRIDEDMADIYESLVNEEGNGLLSLYGEDVSGEMDADDKLSKDSVNSLITNAWNKFKGYKDEMQAVADENHVPLSSIRKRFKYAFTTVNRIQELESYGPTANKLMREVMLSTWNTMDLTGPNKDTHKEDLARAVVQNFGGKLNANDFETGTLPAFNQIFSEVQNHPEKFTNLMQLATNPSKVTTQTVKDAKAELEAFMKNDKACKAIGLTSVDTNFMGLHAMQTLAKVVKAEQEGKDSVEVSIYCEADGTTNGTINTQFLMTNHLEESKPEKGEQITYDENGHEIAVDGDYHDPAEHTILLQDKGNMRLGDYSGTSAGTAKSQYKDTETKDVYALAGKNAQTAISKHVELFTNYVNFTHEASNKYPKGREVLPDHYYQAVDFLFKFSGLTKNLHTRLEDNITRNFMKSPCTKGMYGAGIKSIINTFLYGDRNVSGIIHELHTARTRAMRAYAKAEAEGQVLNDQTVELLVAKAIFGKKGWSKDTENWTDDDYRTHLRQYCWALNTVTQNSLVQYKDKKDKRWHIFCKPVYIFNSEPNSFNANGYYYHRNFTKDTFLNDKIQANQGCATLNLSNANVENIFNAVQTIYGDTIAQTVTGTIRGNNVRGTQDSLLEFAKQSTLLGNIVALVKIKNNKPNESYGRDDLVDFNDEHSPISNVLAADTAAFPIGYDERHSREELSGGSITNYEQFGRYSKVIRNSLYNFIGTNSGEYKYTYLGNPGVRLLPNMAIAFGDGDMMQTAMNSDTFLNSINYATTLIFDGGNAAVGMMHDYGKAINQIQFETDMRNILDPVLVKTASQLAYVENQLNIENSPLHEACQLMANALSFVQDYQDKLDKNGKPLAKQPTSPVYFDALIENLVSCVGQVLDCGTRRSGIKHFLQSRLGKITPANAKGKYVSPVYSSEDFNYNNFNIKTLRSKIKQQVYREIEASLGQTRMLQLVPQNKANNYEVTQEAFNAYQAQLRKKANASIKIPTSINEMQRRELKDCLNMFFGREEYISNGYRFIPGASVSTYCNSDLVANQIQQNAERILDIIQDTTAKIATIQTAKYCMGGTYDHMASHDAPFIHTPTEEGFGKFLDQMHLKFRDNRTTVHSLWTKVQKLTDCLHGETVCSVKKRAEVLRDLQHLIQEYTEYKNDSIDAESARVIENLNKPKPEDSKNIKTISVKQYLKENKAFHAVSAMLGQLFSAITLKGINKDTQIKYFTSSMPMDTAQHLSNARQHAVNILKRTYSQDMQNRIDKEKNLEQKAKLELNRTQTLTYITNKVKEDRLSEGEIAPIQFYDANTNTIYIVPTNPSGINNKAESDLYLNERLPHEIMHSIADKFITHYWKDLKYLTDKGSLNALAEKLSSKDNAKSRAFKRKTYALKALWRLNKLREEFDSIDPKLLDSVSSSSTQLKSYLAHMTRGDWKDSPDQALKEFIATVGSLSDEQLVQLDKAMNQQAPGSLEYLVNRTKQDHSSKTLSAIFNAVKKAFTEFLAAIFNTSKSDSSLRDVIHSNLTIMSAVNEFIRTNREEETITTQLGEQLSEAIAQTSFLDEVDNNSTDTNVSVDATSGSAELNSVPETHESSLDRLSNSLTRAIKERFRTHAKPFEHSSRPNTNVLRKENQKENILADAAYITNTTGTNLESTINSVVTPLQNLGYEVENPKTFANVVSALSLLQGLKAPVLTDVNLAIKKVLDKLTPEALCEDPNNQDELAKAQGLVDFIFNVNKDGLTTEQITPVILALSQTDPAFKRFLSTLPNTKTKHSDEYLALDRFFDNVINKAADQIDKLKHNKSSTMSNKFDRMVKAMSHDERSYNKINFAENALNKVENAISDTIDRLARAALRKMGKDENLSIRGLLVQGENNLNNFKYTPHWISELIHDALGTHPDSYERYAAFSRVKTAVQQTRENARKKTPLILKRKLKGVTQKQWESFTRTIGNTGLSSLFIKNSTKNLATLLRSQSQIKDSIKQLEDVIKDNYRISKCKQLANYQMTGKAGKMLLVNPIAIAKGLGSSNTNMKPSKTEITACDRLTSLYAVQMLSEKERTELADLLEKNPSGMKHLLTVTKNQYKEGIAKANGVNRGENNWRKGVHASAFNNAAHYKVAPLAEREQMERMGYKFISNYQGSNADTAKLGIFYSKLSSTNILNPGAIQNTTATANGVNLSSGFSLAPNAGRITSQKDIKNILSKMDQYSSKNDEDLIPIFDNGGNIVGFERTLNPKLLKNNKYVKPETDFAKLLGIQEGRNIEEKMITDFNKEIVNLVHKTWLNEDGKYKEADFVDLFAEQDPVIKNVVQMMPKEVKQQIKDVYGGNHFYVLRSEVNDVIGYHSASITDSWTGESRLPEPVQKAIVSICEGIMGKNAYKYLKTIETAEQNVVKAAKNAIIVRSLVVPTMNLTANVIQLWIEGVPLTTIMTEMPKVTKELQQYTRIQTQLLELNQELAGETNEQAKDRISKKIDFLTKAQNQLSIAYLLNQKEFATIADIGDSGRDFDFANGTIGDQILEHIDNMSDSNIVRSLTHYAMVAPDTSLYKFLEKTNQYGDFLGRAILFKELTQNRGWTNEQAHLKVKDEFVDYSRLPGRGRDFLERSGLLWFYNFKLRMMKVAAANLKEHPLRSLALTYGGLATPMSDSLLGKLPVLGYSIGPGMLMSAFSCNPWVMLLGLLF